MGRERNMLTEKQEQFARDIASLKFEFQWEAYAASYSTKNMKQDTIYQESCRLLANPKVSARVRNLRDKAAKQSIITLEEILKKITDRMNLDVRDMFEDDGTLKPIKELTFEQGQALASFDVVETWNGRSEDKYQSGAIKKVKLVDFKGIMELMMKKMGLFVNKLDIKVTDIEHIKEILHSIEE